ncbi:MAG: diphthine synthase [Nanoarchaeota archaeon]
MTLYMIGTGISSIHDISCRARQIISTCDKVFLESYTSILPESKKEIEEFLQKPVIVASREMVEQSAETILKPAKESKVALLIIGDVFGATTHTDIMLRAKERDIKVEVIHNASILTAVGITGLELYKFGKTTSMVFFEDDWKPENAYDTIKANQQQGLHTLVLMDIKTAEPARENIKKGDSTPLPSRFMTVNECIEQLFEIEARRQEKIFGKNTQCVGCARLGSSNPMIKSGTAAQLMQVDFGGPLHCLVVPGKLHFIEEEALILWR